MLHSTTDYLTGLLNRHQFTKSLESEINKCKRYNKSLSVMYLDLDGFKSINDVLGHDAGDELLKVVANRLKSTVRVTDLCARLGGDEFVLIITDIKDNENIASIAQLILQILSKPISLKHEEHYISASIGISVYPHNGTTGKQLLNNADIAMYTSKKLGKNMFQYFNPEMTQKAKERLRLTDDLRKAFIHNEFEVYLQPKIDYKSGNIIGAEALIRWNHKEYGLVMPDQFIPIAEDNGFIILLGIWLVNRVCEELYQSKLMLQHHINPAINMSAKQLLNDDFMEGIENLIEDNGISPHQIDIELTESSFLEQNTQAINKLKQLKEIGFSISLDDFGTGYSCLQYMTELPIDLLKIDKSFIMHMITEPKYLGIVRTIISLAKYLNVDVLAEGVETKDQAELLINEGCRYMQGYYFGKPMPWQHFLHLLETKHTFQSNI